MDTRPLTMDKFLAKIELLKEKASVDLSTAEDLSVAVMNLISLEEHFFFTGVKTRKDEYFDTSLQIRDLRKKLLAELVPDHEGETWCISKHLLSATMRLIEVGNKLQSEGKKDKAKTKFEEAYKIYSIFWALKLQLINSRLIENTAKDSPQFEDLVNKLADCCSE